MAIEKVQFRCPGCSKLLAVASVHAGMPIACPNCSTQLRVPHRSTSDPSSTTGKPTPRQATSQPAAQPKSVQRPATQRPQRPANPQQPAPQQPAPQQPAPQQPAPQQPAAANPFAVAKPAENPFSTSAQPAAVPAPNETSEPKPPIKSPGKVAAGLVLASMVAAGCTVVWLIVAAVTGFELGVLAWGIGGLVGLVAGLVGRSGSPVYCGATAVIACMSVLSAKLIMVGFLMLAGFGMQFAQDFAADYSPEAMKQQHAMADQMLSDGAFEGTEKKFAEQYVNSFFSGEYDSELDEETEAYYEASTAVTERLKSELELMSDEEKRQLVEAARRRHPEWIEDHNHYLAVVDKLTTEEGILSDELTAHANFELATSLDSDYDSGYSQSTAPAEIAKRGKELRRLAADKLQTLDEEGRDQAVRDALKRHPKWDPFPDASTAMMEKMNNEGKFQGDLAEHAAASIESQLTDEYPDYFENLAMDEHQKRQQEMQSAISQELVALDAGGRKALIEETRTRYPDWYGQEGSPEQNQEEFQEIMDEIGDGSFLGACKKVFGILDLLWLFLGASTAYGTAKKYGET